MSRDCEVEKVEKKCNAIFSTLVALDTTISLANMTAVCVLMHCYYDEVIHKPAKTGLKQSRERDHLATTIRLADIVSLGSL